MCMHFIVYVGKVEPTVGINKLGQTNLIVTVKMNSSRQSAREMSDRIVGKIFLGTARG